MQLKKTLTLLTGAALVALGTAGGALADRGPGMGGEAMMPVLDFAAMDADRDGSLTEAEIAAFRAAELAKADTDADGKLNAAELAAMQQAAMQERLTERATRMIGAMDGDGDGLLSAEELAAGPKQMSLFERVDADADGKITEAEVEAARAKMAERMGRHHGGDRQGDRDGGRDGGWGFGFGPEN